MVQRLLLDRVDTKTARAAVADQLHFIVESLAHVTQATLAFAQVAMARTQVALQTPVFQPVPVPGAYDGFIHRLVNWGKIPTFQQRLIQPDRQQQEAIS